MQYLTNLRVRIVDVSIPSAEISPVARCNFALAVDLRLEYEPRNPEPERW